MKNIKIGINQVNACAGGKEFLEQAAKLGLAGVEPFIAAADDERLSWSQDEIKQFIGRAERLGMCIPTVAVGIFNGDAAISEETGRVKALLLITRSLEFSAVLGAKVMLLCTYYASNPDTPRKKANILKVLQEIEPMSRKLKVAMALESPLPAEELVQLIDDIGSKWVGVYYDLGNAVGLGYDPVEEIEILGKRILAVHVKDSGNVLGSLHLGQGRLDLASSITALKHIGYRDWYILETPGEDDGGMREDIKMLKRYLKENKL